MPVDKCKFGVFKGITVHMLYYYYDYYHHRRFVFGFLLKSHIWEREESRQSADRFCSQQHKRERDCSDELHEHVRHLTCSLPSECFHLVTTPSAARCEQKLQPWSFRVCSHQTPFKKNMNFILQNTRASAPLQLQSVSELVLLCDFGILKD